jgi:hypothetical protein
MTEVRTRKAQLVKEYKAMHLFSPVNTLKKWSISPTFYTRLIHTKAWHVVFCHDILGLNSFLAQEYWRKCAH